MNTVIAHQNHKGMVSPDILTSVLQALEPYGKPGTSVRWVNWRKDQFQIKVEWNNRHALACYLNFFSLTDRDKVHAKLFRLYADSDAKPSVEIGHGWEKQRHDFRTSNLLTVNELAGIADEMGAKYTIIYAQEDISARPLFDAMGIPLVPGEMGKELIDGVMVPYSRQRGKCL